MNLKEHYKKLYEETKHYFISNNCQVDRLIDAHSDQRFGITLLLRPSINVKNNIQKFLSKLKEIEPDQYYYPNSDIHITVLSIISCYEGFDLNHIVLDRYIKIIQESLIDASKIKIECKGVTASPSCVMIKGFGNPVLNDIRNRLRIQFKNSGLEQSIDTRYTILTAHATVVRYRKPISKKLEFLDLIEEYITYDFGSFDTDRLELVYNDWYQRERYVKKIQDFRI
ncbi:mutarotase [Aquimarina sp. RZ0]|nr:mutarotase [Aquimarina sp. RZ0]